MSLRPALLLSALATALAAPATPAELKELSVFINSDGTDFTADFDIYTHDGDDYTVSATAAAGDTCEAGDLVAVADLDVDNKIVVSLFECDGDEELAPATPATVDVEFYEFVDKDLDDHEICDQGCSEADCQDIANGEVPLDGDTYTLITKPEPCTGKNLAYVDDEDEITFIKDCQYVNYASAEECDASKITYHEKTAASDTTTTPAPPAAEIQSAEDLEEVAGLLTLTGAEFTDDFDIKIGATTYAIADKEEPDACPAVVVTKSATGEYTLKFFKCDGSDVIADDSVTASLLYPSNLAAVALCSGEECPAEGAEYSEAACAKLVADNKVTVGENEFAIGVAPADCDKPEFDVRVATITTGTDGKVASVQLFTCEKDADEEEVETIGYDCEEESETPSSRLLQEADNKSWLANIPGADGGDDEGKNPVTFSVCKTKANDDEELECQDESEDDVCAEIAAAATTVKVGADTYSFAATVADSDCAAEDDKFAVVKLQTKEDEDDSDQIDTLTLYNCETKEGALTASKVDTLENKSCGDFETVPEHYLSSSTSASVAAAILATVAALTF